MLQLNSAMTSYKQATPFECAIISRLVYYSQLEQQRQNSKFWSTEIPCEINFATWRELGWHIYGHCENGAGGYAGSAYINEARKQLVIAHRGTDPCNFGAIFTDYNSVFRGSYSRQPDAAVDFIKSILKNLQFEYPDNDFKQYRITFTGHSLGAWLADVSLCRLKLDGIWDNSRMSAITFDSPGSCSYLKTITKNATFLQELKITNYLAGPNIVNICDLHLGEVYRVYPDIDNPGLLGVNQHSMVGILHQFSAKTNQVKRQSTVIKWPNLDLKGAMVSLESKLKIFYEYANPANDFDPNDVWLLREFYQVDKKIVPDPIIVGTYEYASIRNSIRKSLHNIARSGIDSVDQQINYLQEIETILFHNLVEQPFANIDKQHAILFSVVWEIIYDINHVCENLGKVRESLMVGILQLWLNVLELGVILNFAQKPVQVENSSYPANHLLYRVDPKDREVLTNTLNLMLEHSYKDYQVLPNSRLLELGKQMQDVFTLLPNEENKFFSWLKRAFRFSEDELIELNKMFYEAIKFKQLLEFKRIKPFIENHNFSYQVILLYQVLGQLYSKDITFTLKLFFGDIINPVTVSLADFIEDKILKINVEELDVEIFAKAIKSFTRIWNNVIVQQLPIEDIINRYEIFRDNDSLFHYLLARTDFCVEIQEKILISYYNKSILTNLIAICDRVTSLKSKVKANKSQANLLIDEVFAAKNLFAQAIYIELTAKQLGMLSQLHNLLKFIYDFLAEYCDRYWFTKIIYSGSDNPEFSKYSQQLKDRISLIYGRQTRFVASFEDYLQAAQHDLVSIKKYRSKLIKLQQLHGFYPGMIEKLHHKNSIILSKHISTILDELNDDQDLMVITQDFLAKVVIEHEIQKLQLSSIKSALDKDKLINECNRETISLSIPSKWNIPLYKINNLSYKPLQQSGCAKIYLGEYDNELVAIKIFPPFSNLEQTRIMLVAIDVLSKLNCRYLAKFYGASIADDRLITVTQYCPQQDLRKYLANNSLSVPIKKQLMLHLCYGLAYLHAQEINLVSLSTDDIFIDTNGIAKIANFYLSSKKFEELVQLDTTVPQGQTIQNNRLNIQRDVGMLSVILLEIMTGTICSDNNKASCYQNEIQSATQSVITIPEEFKSLHKLLIRIIDDGVTEKNSLTEIITTLRSICSNVTDYNFVASSEDIGLPRSVDLSRESQLFKSNRDMELLLSEPDLIAKLDSCMENGIYVLDAKLLQPVITSLKLQEVFRLSAIKPGTGNNCKKLPMDPELNYGLDSVIDVDAHGSDCNIYYKQERLNNLLISGMDPYLSDNITTHHPKCIP